MIIQHYEDGNRSLIYSTKTAGEYNNLCAKIQIAGEENVIM